MTQSYTNLDSADTQAADQTDTKLSRKVRNPYRSLLLLRYLLLNVVAFALLGVAWSQGYVHKVVHADQTYLSVVIFIVFVVGLVLCTQRLWMTNREIDALKTADGLQSPAVKHLLSWNAKTCLLYTSPSPRD